MSELLGYIGIIALSSFLGWCIGVGMAGSHYRTDPIEACRKQNNVYACHMIAVPSAPSGATE